MKNLIKHFSLFLTLLVFVVACDSATTSDNEAVNETGTTTKVEGKIVDSETGNGVPNSTVRLVDLQNNKVNRGTNTDASGNYSFEFKIEENNNLTLIATLSGFLADTSTVFVEAGGDHTADLIRMKKDESGITVGNSGKAASINLFSQSSEFIGVKETGALESARIVFEVRDSNGTVINLANASQVKFRLGSSPNGGEYLYPNAALTNDLGRVEVVLNTGSKAGVVQLIAEITRGSEVITSKPIMIAIHGGFPTQDLFYVACEKLNYPHLGVIGAIIDFSAYCGDKYTNPVRPGTAVYYSTTDGIIEGSGLTDVLGIATVKYLTEPSPNHPSRGAGFFEVTSKTIDETSTEISTSTIRLLSGPPIINVAPTTISVNNGGSQTFSFTVMDINGNPMSESTAISVKAETEGDVFMTGATELDFPDTQTGWTNFSFTLHDADVTVDEAQSVTISISISSPNGNLKTSISGVTN